VPGGCPIDSAYRIIPLETSVWRISLFPSYGYARLLKIADYIYFTVHQVRTFATCGQKNHPVTSSSKFQYLGFPPLCAQISLANWFGSQQTAYTACWSLPFAREASFKALFPRTTYVDNNHMFRPLLQSWSSATGLDAAPSDSLGCTRYGCLRMCFTDMR
jgi:hypothetical protein